MKQILIPLEKFDLDGFIYATLNFLQTQVSGDPSSCITWVEVPGRCPNDEGDKGWVFRSKLLSQPVFLFFPFALPDMEGSFNCADGSSYLVTARDFYGDDEDYYEEEIEEDPDERFAMEDIIGYLIRLKEGEIEINLAVCPLTGCLPPPTIDLLPEAHFLEQSLTDFIMLFENINSELHNQPKDVHLRESSNQATR